MGAGGQPRRMFSISSGDPLQPVMPLTARRAGKAAVIGRHGGIRCGSPAVPEDGGRMRFAAVSDEVPATVRGQPGRGPCAGGLQATGHRSGVRAPSPGYPLKAVAAGFRSEAQPFSPFEVFCGDSLPEHLLTPDPLQRMASRRFRGVLLQDAIWRSGRPGTSRAV